MTPVSARQALRAEAEAEQAPLDRLQAELKQATTVNDRMARLHGEHDGQLEHQRQLADGLLERWQAVFAQVELRQRELNLLGRHMKLYRGSYDWLICWLQEARERQERLQALPVGDGQALHHQLLEEKVFKELSWKRSCRTSQG